MVEKFGRYSGLCCQHCVMIRYLKKKKKVSMKKDNCVGQRKCTRYMAQRKREQKRRCCFCILGSWAMRGPLLKANPIVLQAASKRQWLKKHSIIPTNTGGNHTVPWLKMSSCLCPTSLTPTILWLVEVKKYLHRSRAVFWWVHSSSTGDKFQHFLIGFARVGHVA